MQEDHRLYQQGREAMEQGRLEEAVTLLGRSVGVSPHFKTLELLGECHLRLGRLQDAIVSLAAASTLNRGVRAPSLLAEALLQAGDYHQAREVAELALSRDANNRKAQEIKTAAERHLAPV